MRHEGVYFAVSPCVNEHLAPAVDRLSQRHAEPRHDWFAQAELVIVQNGLSHL